MKLQVLDRVKIKRGCEGGGYYEYGTVAAITTNPFDGKTLYIVDFDTKSLTLMPESLEKVKSRKRKTKQ